MRLSRPDAPQDLESAASRNNAARRSSRPLLDPHGIYGTRTAARQRTARRRQAAQSLSILAVIALIVCGVLWWVRGQRVPRLARLERRDLGAEITAKPAWASLDGGDLLVAPREDGSLFLHWNKKGTVWDSTWRGEFSLRASPLVTNSRVYAATENGAVIALDVTPFKDVKVRWQWLAASAISTDPTWFAAPPANLGAVPAGAVAPGAAAAPRDLLIVADDDGTVAGLRPDTGGRVWVQQLRAPAGHAMAQALAGGLVGRVWVPMGAGTSGFEGGLACLDAASGRVLWRLETGAPVLPAPIVDAAGERVYCAGDDGAVWSLDARTGRKIWRRQLTAASPASGTLVLRGALTSVAGGGALVVGGNDGVMRCLSARSGAEIWRFETGSAVFSGATAFKDESGRELLACAGDTSLMWIVDAANGAPVRRVNTSGIPRGARVSGGLDTVSRDGWLERFSLRN